MGYNATHYKRASKQDNGKPSVEWRKDNIREYYSSSTETKQYKGSSNYLDEYHQFQEKGNKIVIRIKAMVRAVEERMGIKKERKRKYG